MEGMCGRFAVTTDPALLAEQIDAVREASATGDAGMPSYNVAPTETITSVVARHREPEDVPSRRIRAMRWGLLPSWTKAAADGTPVSTGPLLFNARADKVATSPAFRSSARYKRCLVPMDGYYEWRADPARSAGRKAHKTPFYIYRDDGAMLFMAGLWSVWKDLGRRSSHPLLSCTILTTDAVGELAGIHDRMPLMVAENDWDTWLDPDAPADAALLANPPDVRGIVLREVSPLVNSVRNNGPRLIEPAEPRPEQATLL